MTLPSNNEVQAAIIARLKAQTTVTAEVVATEIREDQWQGTDFSYPNIRVKMLHNRPQEDNCNKTIVDVSVQVFGEDASTLQTDRIAGIITNVLHTVQFSSSGTQVSLRVYDIVPSIRSNARTWRSEVLLAGIASG